MTSKIRYALISAFLILVLFLSGCSLTGGTKATSTQVPALPTSAGLPSPTLPLDVPSPTPTPLPPPLVDPTAIPPTDTSVPCVTPLLPVNGSTLGTTGYEQFAWSEYAGASKYILVLVLPDGTQEAHLVLTNAFGVMLDTYPTAGTYQWSVIVMDQAGQPVCSSELSLFVKPESAPISTSTVAPIVPTSTQPSNCVALLSPPDGSALPVEGAVNFTWAPWPNASKYIITIDPPNTPPVTFMSTTTYYVRYLESFPDAGVYSWYVTPKASNGAELCTSAIFTFSKPETIIIPNSPAVFSNQTGPMGNIGTCSNFFSVDVEDAEGVKIVYVIYRVYNTFGELYYAPVAQTLTFNSGITWDGTLSIKLKPGYTVVWGFDAVDELGDANYTGSFTYTYTGMTSCSGPLP